MLVFLMLPFFIMSPAHLNLLLIVSILFVTISLTYATSIWLGLINGIIFLGGLLVIFAYFITIRPSYRVSSIILINIIILAIISPWLLNIYTSLSPFLLCLQSLSCFLIFLLCILTIALIAIVKSISYENHLLRPFV